jgi:hypothetical protein
MKPLPLSIQLRSGDGRAAGMPHAADAHFGGRYKRPADVPRGYTHKL